MGNHALVIGCDAYWDDASTLRGAVSDALAFRAWLLDPAGGDVAAQNLTLLLSPSRFSQVPPGLTGVPPATRGAIVQGVDGMLRRCDGDDGTLYFYFAGHGLTASADGYDEPCLLPADFLPGYRDPALPIRDVREQLATTSLGPQFLFVDACRSAPVGASFRARGLSDRRPRDYRRPEPDQYVRFATSAGDPAYERRSGDTAGGEFTAALLRGLRGAGAAKRWDPEHEQYVLRVRELFDFVAAELAAAGVEQVPRALDCYGEPNPVLARFPEDAFPPVTLTLAVSPPEAAAETTIGTLGPADRISRPPLAIPLTLRLAPRTYSVRAHAARFTPRRRSWHVDLYDDATLEVALDPGDPGAPPSWLSHRPQRGFERCSPAQSLAVSAAAPGAVLEVQHESGVVRLLPGPTTLDRPGRYGVRIVAPHGAGPVRVVEVPAEHGGQRAAAPPPVAGPVAGLAMRLARDAGLRVDADGWWIDRRTGRRLAPLPAGAVAGLTALAVLTAGEPAQEPGDLGLTASLAGLAAGRPGVALLLIGADRPVSARAVDGPAVAPTVLRRCHEHVAVAALPLDPGPVTLQLDGLLPARLRLAAYVPATVPALVVVDLADPAVPVIVHAPVGDIATFVRADTAQRFVAQGRLAEAQAVLDAGPAGPPGAVLRGLLAARRGAAGVADVRRCAATLRHEAPGLPDVAVLEALAAVGDGPPRRPGRAASPGSAAVPVLALALAAASRLHHDAGLDLPAALTQARDGLVPGRGATAWSSRDG